MSSDRPQPRRTDHESTRDNTLTLSQHGRRLTVPNERSGAAIVSFVDWVLVELTHEEVFAEYRSSHVWGIKRTQYVTADEYGQTFLKRYYDERLGWHEETISRTDLRIELVHRLSRTRPETSDRRTGESGGYDTFVVKRI